MADYLNIAGRIRTTASDGVAMEAQEVKDLNLNKSQQEINADVQTELGDRYTKEETYNREELNELITTPDVNRVYVIATNLTTAVTDLLPETGSSDTLYNVGNWNGTQYDTTVYSIYGWDGSAYVCLAVRSSIGEVYDISANHPDGQGNPTPYADLAAALGTGGANIPADIRRGGMSIKFIQGTVQSSDNKYVQYRLMAQSFSTNETDWCNLNYIQDIQNGVENTTPSSKVVGELRNQVKYLSSNIVKFYNGHIAPDGTDGTYHRDLRLVSNYFKIHKHSLLLSDYTNMYIFEYDEDLNFVSVNNSPTNSYTAASDKIIRILLFEYNNVTSFDLLEHFSIMRMSNTNNVNFCNVDKTFRSIATDMPINPTDLTWIHGHITPTGDIGTYNMARRLVSDICFFKKGTKVSSIQNTSFFIMGYNKDFSFYKQMCDTSDKYTFTESTYAKIVLIDSASTARTEEGLINCLYINSPEDSLSYRQTEQTSDGYTRLSFEHGKINNNGQVDHSYKNEFMSAFHLFKKGDIIDISQIENLYSSFEAYLSVFDGENGLFLRNNAIGTVYTLQEDLYGRLCVYSETETTDLSFKWFGDNVKYLLRIPKKSIDATSLKASFVKNYTGNVTLSFSQGGYNNNISETSSYKYDCRIHSDIICAKKGDRILHKRTKGDEVLNIITVDNNYTFVKSENIEYQWSAQGYQGVYDVKEDSFIILESFYTSDSNWEGAQLLIDCISYDRLGDKNGFDLSNFEHGLIQPNGKIGFYSSYAASKNIFHVKRGTQIVPYVFGRYCIALYDDNMNFIKRLPEDIIDPNTGEKVADGGQHNTGWFEQNAYEFKEDANIRVMLSWMAQAGFYSQTGFENIIPNDNVVEHIVCKFRLIEPNYPVPEYVKQEVANTAKTLDKQCSGLFKFTFITDDHEYAYHDAAAVYCANLTSRVLIHGGDLLSWPLHDFNENFETVQRHIPYLLESKVPVLVTKGNHEATITGTDVLGNQHTNYYTKESWYEQVQLPLRRKEYVYHDNAIIYDGTSYKDPLGGYFYYDDELYKVRIICMDMFVGSPAHVMTNNQRVWLAYDALDLSSKGVDEENWCVIALGHSQILDGDVNEPNATREERWCCDVFDACYNKELTVISDPESDPGYHDWTSLTPDFSNIKYQFVAYICGHVHYDSVASKNYQSTASTHGLVSRDFLHISTTCSHPLENEDALRRDFNTITEYAIDVFCLDKTSRKLIIKRIGTGSDREVIY